MFRSIFGGIDTKREVNQMWTLNLMQGKNV